MPPISHLEMSGDILPSKSLKFGSEDAFCTYATYTVWAFTQSSLICQCSRSFFYHSLTTSRSLLNQV